MDIKKVLTKDVYQTISSDIQAIYKDLQKEFGSDTLFAKFDIGGGFYLWSDHRNGWKPMNEASAAVQQDVRAVFLREKEEMIKKKGNAIAERLFTYPDDSYIYFKDDGGEIEVLLTGWGFKKPVKHDPQPNFKKIKVEQSITVSFSVDGVPQPEYAFAIKLPTGAKQLLTGQDGRHVIGKLKAGENRKLIDAEGKEHLLEIIEGQTHYDFNVTPEKKEPEKELEPLKLFQPYIKVVDEDGNPLSDYPLTIDIEGMSYDSKSSIEGKVDDLRVMWHSLDADGNVMEQHLIADYITVIDGNNSEHTETVHLQMDQEEYMFVVPKAPEEELEPLKLFQPYIKVVDEDGNPLPDYPLTIDIEGKSYDSKSSLEGKVDDLRVMWHSLDADGNVTEQHLIADHITIIDGNNSEHTEIIRLEMEQEEYMFVIPKAPERIITIRVRDASDRPMECERMVISQSGMEDINLRPTLDGSVNISAAELNTQEPLSVSLKGAKEVFAPIGFTLDDEEDEYLLQEQEVKPKANKKWLGYMLIALGAIAMIATCLFLPKLCEMVYRAIY